MTKPVGETILVTGAGGIVGTLLRSRLAAPGRTLRLLDRSPLPPAAPGEAVLTIAASVTDLPSMIEACEGVDAVIHLAGLSGEAPFDQILAVNVQGSQNVLEAAHRAGVRTVILASSNHAVGYVSRSEAPPDGLPADLPPRPDSFYGWSKAAMEALGRLYVDTYDLDVFCLRIGSCFDLPADVRQLSTWMSPDDCARLMEACLHTENGGFHLIWGVSPNTRRWWSLSEGTDIGYHPVDNAEVFAKPLIERFGEPDFELPEHALVGGKFCATPLGVPVG